MERWISLAGIGIFIGLAWLLSERRHAISWSTVAGALLLDFTIGALIFLVPHSTEIFLWLNRAVIKLLSFAGEGARFLFGVLALEPGERAPDGSASLGYFMAFQMLPAVIFFSALMSLLYHLKVIQPLIRFFAILFRRFMKLSGAEALCNASNIFVGIEAVFSIRPFLERLTRSEFFTILTACMATVASTTLAIYVSFLKDQIPTIAGHLISASVLAIPASIMISKIMVPETGEPVTMGHLPAEPKRRSGNFMGAVVEGAWEGMKLAVGIGTLLIAVLGLVALADAVLRKTGTFFPGAVDLSLKGILGWLMIPFVWCLGITGADLVPAAQILGERWILTEVVAYRDLASMSASGAISSLRTLVVMSYALCGFTHVASVAIFVGGVSALVPSRRDEIAALGMKSLFAAFLATVTTGAIAGVFFIASQTPILRGV